MTSERSTRRGSAAEQTHAREAIDPYPSLFTPIGAMPKLAEGRKPVRSTPSVFVRHSAWKRTYDEVALGSIFRNCDRSRRSDHRSAVKVEAVVRASEVGIAPWTGLWQHEEAGAATRRSRPRADCRPTCHGTPNTGHSIIRRAPFRKGR